MAESIPFLTVFPGCEAVANLCGGLSKVSVTSAHVDTANASMTVEARFTARPSAAELAEIQRRIEDDYGLSVVRINPDFPPPVPSNDNAPADNPGAGALILGTRQIKGKPVPMADLTAQSGKVIVEGDVFKINNKDSTKRGGALLSFYITDRTNSISVTKFIRSDGDKSILGKISAGDRLMIRGEMSFSRYDGEMYLEPETIVKVKKTVRPDTAKEKRVELHAHTCFSTLDALTDPAALVSRAIYWGMPAIAVTDHGNAQAFPEMWHAAQKKDIKIIYGMEAYFVPCRGGEEDYKAKSYHMILLVKNKKGLKNLYEMISASYLKYFHRAPRIPQSLLEKYREGIIVGSACSMGELYEAILAGASEEELEKIASIYDYLEIQPTANNNFLLENGTIKDVKGLQDINRRIINLADRLGKPTVATCDVHFLDPEDEEYRHVLQAAKKFTDADKSCPIYLRSTDEMLAEFSYLGAEKAYEVVVKNTRDIAESVDKFDLFPKELYPPKIEHSAEQLSELVYGKMHRIYGENPPEIVTKRVETELKTILDHSYDVIYMSAQKLVQNSLEHGYLVGSRGSVGSSIVAYMSGITEVNSLPPHYVCPKCTHSEFVTDGSYGCGADMPEKNCPVCGTPMRRDGFDIPFETFLGYPGNEKTPDIDLNFSGEYQAKAHKYTETLFGSDHVFRAGTYGMLADKTAYGYALKYLEERGEKKTRAEEERLASGIVGVKRTTGQHPGGLVVIPQDMDVTDFCPVQHPADDPDSDIITTHFEYHCMEDNLLKLDELGHDDPTMIRMMEDMTGVDAKQISLSDPETMSIYTSPAALGLPDDDPIIGKTGTIGVPEFGTGFTRQMLVDTQPKQFNTLVRLSGFSHGTDVWNGNIHDLIVSGTATVDETVGCRDDIMLYLISVGMEPSLAFKTMEAVRKGKVQRSGSFPGDSEEQMRRLGVPDWYIESCRKIQYLFPKAHAVAYVMMAFRIAWFKVHYPIAFYSAYFYRRSQKGGFDAALMTHGTEETRRVISAFHHKDKLTANEEDLLTTLEAVYEFNMRGFEFAPIDVFKSHATKFIPVDDKHLLPPFVSVAGLGENAAWDLYKAVHPEDGSKPEFMSVDELSHACPKVGSASFDKLREMGALGDLPVTSQIVIEGFEGFF